MADQWNVTEIEKVMRDFASLGLSEMELHDGEFSLKLASASAGTAAAAPQTVLPASAAAPSAPPQEDESLVCSPIVGTFYAAPAPEKAPFVEVGTKVKKGDVLFVIESMKLMNEIQSEYDGEVVEIIAKNGEGVEFHQPIMRVIPR